KPENLTLILRPASSGGTLDCIPVARSSKRSNRPNGILSALIESLLSTRSISGPLAAADRLVKRHTLRQPATSQYFIFLPLLKDTLNYSLVHRSGGLYETPIIP